MKLRLYGIVVIGCLLTLCVLYWTDWGSFAGAIESEKSDKGELTEEAVASPQRIPATLEQGERSVAKTAQGADVIRDSLKTAEVDTFKGKVAVRIVLKDFEEIDLTGSDIEHSHKIKEWRGRLEPSLAALKTQFEAGSQSARLGIGLPDDSEVVMTSVRFEIFGGNRGVVTGKILGDEFGEVVLSYVNRSAAGSIRDNARNVVWEIRNAGEGKQYFAQVDVGALGECGHCKIAREAIEN